MTTALLDRIRECPAAAFFTATFLLSWGLWIPVGLLSPERLRWFALPGAWMPTLVAVALTALLSGPDGLRILGRRFIRLRIGIGWLLFAVLAVPAVSGLATMAHWLLGGPLPSPRLPEGVPAEAWPVALPVLFLANLFIGGPLAEEAGWRGFALTALRHRGTLSAGAWIGATWAAWHLPFFLLPGGETVVGDLSFPAYALIVVPWSMLFCWWVARTESLVPAVLGHASLNTTLGTLGIPGSSNEDGPLLVLHVVATWLLVGLVAWLEKQGA